jgi:cytochrome bd-type quinol oxidase subunit 2
MLPSLLALLGVVFDTQVVAAVSFESAAIVAICLVPQSMHLVAWDTSRIWTYSILCAFLVLWVDVELRPERKAASQFAVFVSLVALLVNAIATTPLMDGLTDRLSVTTRLLLYAPVVVVGMVLAGRGTTERRAKRSPERATLG